MFNMFRGWVGEKATQLGLWLLLDGNTYIRFHNVIVPSQNGSTQIDHVLISRFGIFVVETKNFSGLIYGSEKDKYWTQVLPGKKSKFQNPLNQNYKHKKALSEQLGIEHDKIHSVIYFVGDAEIRIKMPPNVFTSPPRLARYIEQFNEVVFSDTELAHFERVLIEMKGTLVSSIDHVLQQKIRYSSNATCPKCGGDLVNRETRRVPKAGTRFLGCSNYPKCRYTRD